MTLKKAGEQIGIVLFFTGVVLAFLALSLTPIEIYLKIGIVAATTILAGLIFYAWSE